MEKKLNSLEINKKTESLRAKAHWVCAHMWPKKKPEYMSTIISSFYTMDKGVSAFSRCTLRHVIGMTLGMTVYTLFRLKILTILDILLKIYELITIW